MNNTSYYPTLYLHIGAEKTGSTSIQQFLSSSSSLLKKYNFCYINFSHPSYFSSCFDSQRLHGDLVRTYTSVDSIQHTLDKHLSLGFENYIISSEYLFSRLRSPADIQALSKFLLKRFKHVVVIAFYRNAGDLVNSLASEAIKAGQITVWKSNEFLTSEYLQHALAFHNVLKVWSHFFSDTRVSSYDQALLSEPNIITTFVRILDPNILTDEALFRLPSVKRNTRITYLEAVMISRISNFLDYLPNLKFSVRQRLLAVARRICFLLTHLTPAALNRTYRPFDDREVAYSVNLSSDYQLR